MDEDLVLNSPTYSQLSRMGNAARSHALRLSGHSGLASGHKWRARADSGARPTFVKRFERHKGIQCRVFIPRESASGQGMLPLYIDVHGGGFIMGSSELDDFFCAGLAEMGICVVSIDYRKSPSWKFPVPVHDVAEVAIEVMEAEGLPIDRNRVAIGGFSNGGTLALSAAQTERLRGRIRGVVAFNPLTDFAVSPADKLANGSKGPEPDRIGKEFADVMQKAYIPNGTDLRDPLLSPAYANRSSLPNSVYIIGAELDMFCAEAERLAVSLAVQDTGTYAEDSSATTWEKGNVRWELIRGWRHNFTHIAEKGVKETERRALVEALFHRVGLWLLERVYN